MKTTLIRKKHFLRLAVSTALIASFILSLFTTTATAEKSTILDLAMYSERYLSDFALADGGTLKFDTDGSVLFDLSSAGSSLRFKCTGAFSSGEQNAVCIKMKNGTGSTKMSVEIVFMDYNSNLHKKTYEKTVSNTSSDSYIFIQSPENLFVTEITIKATGVGAGRLTVMGIWHCYYYFGEDGSNTSVGSISKLEYKNNGKSVAVEGSIHHDITISSKNSRIELYRLLPGEKMDEAFLAEHTPCAQSLMSRSFSFNVSNVTGDDMSSAYALVIVSADGALEYVIEDKRYPTSPEKRVGEDVGFKGVATSLEYLSSRTNSDTLMIDIYTDEVISDRLNGYLYSFCGESYCFDSDTVNSIDRRVTSASPNYSGVYFRFTLKENMDYYGSPGTVYDADGSKAKELYALISFLCERYSEKIGGIVVGSKFDIPHTYGSLIDESYEEYLRKYSDYLSIVCAAIQNSDSGARVIVPLSSNNSRIYGENETDEKYPMSAMLISLLELYSHINNADLTLMVCDDSFPSVDYIKNRLLGGGGSSRAGESESFRDQSGEIMNISSENTEVFEDLIKTITEFFDFIDTKYFFTWEPYGIYPEAEYEVAYAYTYFNLCENPNVLSFICDFTKDERSGSHEKSNSMTNVITAMGSADAISFADLITKKAGLFTLAGIDGYDRYTADGMKVVSLTHQSTPIGEYLGSIELSDLSKPSTFSSWRPGAYTEYISMASVGDGTRSLKAMMTLPYYSSEFAEIVYLFDSPADLSPINVITFSLMIDTASSDTSGEYTVRTVIGGENMSTVAESTVNTRDGERFLLSVDVSSLTEMKNTYYVKICVQNNSGRDDEIITNVLSVSAYSNTHTDEELKGIFSTADNTLSEENNRNASEKWRSAAIVILFAVAIFTVLAIFIYRKSSLEDSEQE